MGLTKPNNFTDRQNRISELYKALAHPARIAIIDVLISKGSCICGDIVNELPLSQSTISQHLKELKKAGIIKGEVDGVKTCYCIDNQVWNDLNLLTKDFINNYAKTKCC